MSDADNTNEDEAGTGGDQRALVVVPDANVVIHGKALVDLPWPELRRPIIEVRFVPPMVQELDKLKNQGGRPNKLARQLSSDIRKLVDAPDHRAVVRREKPAVSKLIELQAVTQALHPTLQLGHADQALINYCLHLKQQGLDVLLVTDDTICGTTARGVGLTVLFLPEHWRRPPEAEEGAKDIARLTAELHRLRSQEPAVELRVEDAAGNAFTEVKVKVPRWQPLSQTELEDLVHAAEQVSPIATSFEPPKPSATSEARERIERLSRLSAFGTRTVFEPATEDEIEEYKTTAYPSWLNSVRDHLSLLHERLQARTEWPTLIAVAGNTGTRPATEALLGIEAKGPLQLKNVDNQLGGDGEDDVADPARELELPSPPAPPRGRTKQIDPYNIYGAHAHAVDWRPTPLLTQPHRFTPPVRDADVFYWRRGQRDWTDLMELECASWRHGQGYWRFKLQLRPATMVPASGAIEISLHANNLSEPKVITVSVRIEVEDGDTLAEARRLVGQLESDR